MPLVLMKAGDLVRVLAVKGTDALRKRLGALGFVPGAVVSVVQIQEGNLILGVQESRIALGCDTATRVIVEPAA